MKTRYAHSLLFACPNCQFPIVIACLSEQRVLEHAEEQFFAVTCGSCRYSFNLPASKAKKQYVEEWPEPKKK